MKPLRPSSSFSSAARSGRGRRRLAGSLVAAAVAVLGWYWPALSPLLTPGSNRLAPAASTGSTAVTGALAPPNGTSATYNLIGAVASVSDGDTIRFRSGASSHRIRLDSIDAPELDHGPGQPGQNFASEARDHLANWISGKTLTAQCYGRDQFDRDLCDLLSADGESANREMVRTGYAWAYTAARGRYLRDATLPALQAQARAARRGLWAGDNPVQPWQWRYNCWRQRQCR
jgi:micrococcal nuclease